MMNGYEYTGMDAILAGSFRAAIYCRLSKDDDLDGESASIANQRDMLESYCEKQGWEVVAVYQDDGYTGLNMERPDLKRMLKAIERRQINLVITKDLSRLGRNYLQTGTLIEDFFPRHGVRYIAMNDGIDTMRDNNDIAPFKNILNEMYSKDISKKVHSSYLLKAQQGQFTGCVAPFGYRKDPEDKTTCWWTRKPPLLSGKSSFGRWKDTAPTSSGADWKNKRCLALHGGTGNGVSAMSAPNGKRKTRKTGGICGISP